jgi:hypothetical protein
MKTWYIEYKHTIKNKREHSFRCFALYDNLENMNDSKTQREVIKIIENDGDRNVELTFFAEVESYEESKIYNKIYENGKWVVPKEIKQPETYKFLVQSKDGTVEEEIIAYNKYHAESFFIDKQKRVNLSTQLVS